MMKMMMLMTLTVKASYDGVRQPGAARLLVNVQLDHRRWNDVLEASPCVVQSAPLIVAESTSAVNEGLKVVRPLPPAGVGALKDGHQ